MHCDDMLWGTVIKGASMETISSIHQKRTHGNIDKRAVLACKQYNNEIRYKPGERLEKLFEERCDQFESESKFEHLAIITSDMALSYVELDKRANQLARYLYRHGIRAGDRIGLLFDKTCHTYVSLLAVLKLKAVYVPLDRGFPKERINVIIKDA
jgi:non-ribosomal peptide synthetase component F